MSKIPPAIRLEVLERDGSCRARPFLLRHFETFGPPVACSGGPHIHHLAGRSGPDPHRPDNLVLLCSGHHAWVHSHPALAREWGLMVSRFPPPGVLG